MIVLPQWLHGAALPLLVAAEFVLSLVSTLSGINRVSVMQALTPNRLLGRVWASISFIGLGVVPVGAFVGGALGGRIGVPATILVCACGGLPSFVWHLCSPVRHLRELPLPVEDVPGGPPA